MYDDGAKPPRCSRWGGLPPHRYFRTVHETFDLTRLLSTRAVVTSTTTNKPSWLAFCSGWMAEFWLCSAVFSTSKTPAIKPSSFHCRRLPVYPTHVSISIGFPEGIGFLGHPSRLGLRLVACSIAGEPQTGYSVPSVHYFVTVGWCFTPSLI